MCLLFGCYLGLASLKPPPVQSCVSWVREGKLHTGMHVLAEDGEITLCMFWIFFLLLRDISTKSQGRKKVKLMRLLDFNVLGQCCHHSNVSNCKLVTNHT